MKTTNKENSLSNMVVHQPEEIDFDTKLLRYIVAIVDEKSLSEAANKLYLSQPALSRYLKKIEQDLGMPIFVREHNELHLTNAGKIFINGARSIIQIEDEALLHIINMRMKHKDSVHIIVQDIFANFVEKEITPVFSHQFPDVNLSISISNETKARRLVNEGVVDLGIFIGLDESSPFYHQCSLLQSELVFYAASNSTGYNLSIENGFKLKHYKNDPMILSPVDSFLSQLQERILKDANIVSPDICARVRLPLVNALISQGYGNTILPIEAIHGRKENIFHFEPAQQYNCLAAWYKGRPISKYSEQYLKIAKEKFSKFNSFSQSQ